MKVLLEFESTLGIVINSVSVIGSFNGLSISEGRMNQLGLKWVIEIDMQPGEHYYKFVINDHIKMNDPAANYYIYENNEIWSGVIINKENKRLYNNTQYTVHIEKYNIQNHIEKDIPLVNKRDFNLLSDTKVVTSFEFTNVTGLHSATVLWCTPIGGVFDTAESILIPSDRAPNIIWFSLELNKNDIVYAEGIWTMKLLIDGILVIEDKFKLMKMNTYGPQGMVY